MLELSISPTPPDFNAIQQYLRDTFGHLIERQIFTLRLQPVCCSRDLIRERLRGELNIACIIYL